MGPVEHTLSPAQSRIAYVGPWTCECHQRILSEKQTLGKGKHLSYSKGAS